MLPCTSLARAHDAFCEAAAIECDPRTIKARPSKRSFVRFILIGASPVRAAKRLLWALANAKGHPMILFQRRALMIILAAAMLIMGEAAGALAASRAGYGVGHGAERIHSGSGGSILTTPSTTRPAFNPWYQNTVPQAPETPVSPASPGSVFGNN